MGEKKPGTKIGWTVSGSWCSMSASEASNQSLQSQSQSQSQSQPGSEPVVSGTVSGEAVSSIWGSTGATGAGWGGSGIGTSLVTGGVSGEMESDPAPEKPSFTLQETPQEPDMRPSERWLKENAVPRVPLVALEEDMYRIPGQNFVCFSVIRPEDYKELHHESGRYSGSLIKFRGVFATREEADAHIRKVMNVDRHFDIHLVPAFTWAAMDEDDLENREYVDEKVSEILKGYFEEERKRREHMHSRIKAVEDTPVTREFRNEEASSFFHSANPDVVAPAFFSSANYGVKKAAEYEEEEAITPENWVSKERESIRDHCAKIKPIASWFDEKDMPDLAESMRQSGRRLKDLAESLASQDRSDVVISSELEEPLPRISAEERVREVVEEVLLEDDDAATASTNSL